MSMQEEKLKQQIHINQPSVVGTSMFLISNKPMEKLVSSAEYHSEEIIVFDNQFKEKKESQIKRQSIYQSGDHQLNLNVKQQLIKILKEAGIDQQQQISKCLQLFQQKKMIKLLFFPRKQHRALFSKSFNQLLQKIQRYKPKQIKAQNIAHNVKQEFTSQQFSQLLKAISQFGLKCLIKQDNSDLRLDEEHKRQFIQILKSAQIEEQQYITQCQLLFQKKKISQLIEYSSGKNRAIFIKSLQQILSKIQNKQNKLQKQLNQINSKQELMSIFKQANIIQKEQINECYTLFQENKINQLKTYPSFKYRNLFGIKLDNFVLKNSKKLNQSIKILSQKNDKQRLAQILRNCQINDKQQIQQCLDLYQNNYIIQLKNRPKKRHRQFFNEQLNKILLTKYIVKQPVSDQQKRRSFDRQFTEKLKSFQMPQNLEEYFSEQYQKVYSDWVSVLKQQNEEVLDLPSQNKLSVYQNCKVQQMLLLVKSSVIDPNTESYQDILVYTNVQEQIKSQASRQYFDLRKYFKIQKTAQFYAISPDEVIESLNKDEIKQLYIKKMGQVKGKIDMTAKLNRIWKEINQSLQIVGLMFPDFRQFVQAFQMFEGNPMAKILNMKVRSIKQQIKYQFLDKIVQNKCSVFGFTPRNTNRHFFSQQKQIANQKHKLSHFLYQVIPETADKKCICTYSRNDLKAYLSTRLFQHINWKNILAQVQKDDIYRQKQMLINRNITQIINEDIKKINIQIISPVDWKKYISDSDVLGQLQQQGQKNQIYIAIIKQPAFYSSVSIFQVMLQQSTFIIANSFKNRIKIFQKPQHILQKNNLPIVQIKNIKFEPTQDNNYFQKSLKENKCQILELLTKPIFQQFLLNELKYGRQKSLDLFYFNICKVIKQIAQTNLQIHKDTYINIFNKIKHQISKFNNDLRQVSYKLSNKYTTSINLAVIYIIWKLLIDKKLKERKQCYEAYAKQYQNQWQLFKQRNSLENDVENNLLQKFMKSYINLFKNIIRNKQNKKIFFSNQAQVKYIASIFKKITGIEQPHQLAERFINTLQIISSLEKQQ